MSHHLPLWSLQVFGGTTTRRHTPGAARSSSPQASEVAGECRQGDCGAACSQALRTDMDACAAPCSPADGLHASGCLNEQSSVSGRHDADPGSFDQDMADSHRGCACLAPPGSGSTNDDRELLFDMSPEWRRALQSLASVPGLNVFACKSSSQQLQTREPKSNVEHLCS